MIDKLLEKYKKIKDERFFKELFEGEEYKPCLDIKADVVLDIGALAGEFSAYIYNKAKVIYAIEPHPKYYEELSTNIKEFGLNKIKPFNLALSDYNGEGKLRIGGRGGSALANDGTETVKVLTLSTFIKENNIKHIDLLKIDIEGGEEKVFSAKDFAEISDRIDFIIGEHIGDNFEPLLKQGFKYSTYQNNQIYKR